MHCGARNNNEKPSPYRTLLSNKNFLTLFAGQFVSFLGDRINYLALVGLAAAETSQFAASKSPLELSKISVIMFLPALIFSPVSGVLIDRWNTKRVLVTTDFARAMIVALIPLTRAAFDTPLPAYSVVFLLYTLNVFFLPARSAILPELVGREDLLDANSLSVFGMILATIVGSVAGGVIVSRWGWQIGFYVDSASYFVSVAALAAIRYTPGLKPAPRELPDGKSIPERGSFFVSDFKEGWRLILKPRRVRAVFTLLALLWIVSAALHVRGIILIKNVTGNAVRDVGVMISFMATGMLIGSYLTSRIGRLAGRHRMIIAGFLTLGVLFILFAQARSLTQMILIASAGGIAAAPILIGTETFLQESIPLGKRARVFGSKDFVTKSLFMLSAVALGALGGGVPEGVIFLAAGVAVLVLSVWLAFQMRAQEPGAACAEEGDGRSTPSR